jgi:lipid-A-disaccharide synthase
MFDVPPGVPSSGGLSGGGAQRPEGGTTSQPEGWTTNPPESGTPNLAPKVALFPGSRKAEIDAHMPAMLQVAQQIKGRFPKASFTAAAPSEERAWQIRHHHRSGNTPIDIRVGDGDAVIAWADVVLCKSGTTTLQIARQIKPMVVIFKVPRWQWAFARHFITTPHIALVNILAGREIVKEFIPFHGNAAPVAKECLDLIAFPAEREKMQQNLQNVVTTLVPRNGISATGRVAEEVVKLLAAQSRA